ncbi:MAG: sporulation protein [Gammaproteobacteria bacterium]|nr:sporulation protein [Gammaproteobacteria bacterium]NIR96950.1 sporulation protein [Gammaproteobacteria bacterium]NIT62652.1 sporulation protein [Gammaproteobacteria bacterium]NIV19612.1 sporulation protein [Gammaproteobacteria bacterium]NIX10832.1 sporulation protein [Gammaproteobacteria bacterium]
MEFLLKQRLVGAAVLIALAVVIIPMLLDGSGRDVIHDIPPAPQPSIPLGQDTGVGERVPLPPPEEGGQVLTDEGPVPYPQLEDGAGERPAAEAAAEAERDTASTPEEPATEPAGASVPEAWVVQVGSFGEQGKATALRDRLVAAGFKAFVERFQGGAGKSMFRVRVGPELTREAAEALDAKLRKVEGVEGTYVTSHP